MSQRQEDNRLHPVAYAGQSVSATEANYAVTNLETLAVVLAITHFRYYLYWHNVTVITNHAAVKVILEAPKLNGQHAKRWNKVYIWQWHKIDIVHRAGNGKQHADILSKQPVLPAPPDDGVGEEVKVALISSNEAVSISTLIQIMLLIAMMDFMRNNREILLYIP